MRIVGGLYKRRIAKIPQGLPTRPTTERTREALASIIESRLDLSEANVLDIFSGTGMVTLELISRGATQITSVDKYVGCLNCLRQNLNLLKINTVPNLIQQEAIQFLTETTEQYDVIYADPPYNWNATAAMLELIFSKKLLSSEGLLILEHITNAGFDFRPEFTASRKYGTTALSLFSPVQS